MVPKLRVHLCTLEERSKGVEARPEGLVERLEVRMPVWVTIQGENPWRLLGKVSWARFVHPGLVGA